MSSTSLPQSPFLFEDTAQDTDPQTIIRYVLLVPLLIVTIGSSIIVPILVSLFFFSTSVLRRKPIFIINVLSILSGIGMGVANIYIAVSWTISLECFTKFMLNLKGPRLVRQASGHRGRWRYFRLPRVLFPIHSRCRPSGSRLCCISTSSTHAPSIIRRLHPNHTLEDGAAGKHHPVYRSDKPEHPNQPKCTSYESRYLDEPGPKNRMVPSYS